MKKKLIIGLIGATAVFAAVFGAAASLGGITTEDLGADNTSVVSCDTDGVTTSYAVAYDGTAGGYKVSSVTVSGIASTCEGQKLNVAVQTGATATSGTEATIGVGETSKTVSFGSGPLAEDVTGVHVAIQG
jgi:hypothetical protein